MTTTESDVHELIALSRLNPDAPVTYHGQSMTLLHAYAEVLGVPLDENHVERTLRRLRDAAYSAMSTEDGRAKHAAMNAFDTAIDIVIQELS